MRGFRVAVVVVALCTDNGFVDATIDYGVFTPKKLALGTAPTMGASDYASGFTLTAAEPIATLDYGYEVVGLPYFVVSAVSSGPVDVEVKYSEQFSVLSTNFSDGPSHQVSVGKRCAY
ncbi:Glycoside hydrolase [Phytophthora cinnamomi]|uniref:Glycoside hydrolase n=1 Tax=Phytophthora cinnamomi TaxID=4785 RepID=UPI00355A7CB8|nr:Glycoside hydrolase [Phytophthora cinnamomi]